MSQLKIHVKIRKNLSPGRYLLVILLPALIFSCGRRSEERPGDSGFEMGLERLVRPELLPYLHPPGTETMQFTSYDPRGKSWDGVYDLAFRKYTDENGEDVIFDSYGPGCLYRHQMNIWQSFREHVGPEFDLSDTLAAKGRHVYDRSNGKARIKYYFDDEATPRIDLSMDEFFGRLPFEPFLYPFSFYDSIKHEFAVNYFPLFFKKRLKVTVVPSYKWHNAKFYNLTCQLYPQATGKESWNPSVVIPPGLVWQWFNPGKDPKDTVGNDYRRGKIQISRGQSFEIFKAEGAGSVSSIRIDMNPYEPDTYYQTRIRIYWDDIDIPAVDLPVGYFFGGGGEHYDFADEIPFMKLQSLFFGFNGQERSFYSFWPMPFWKSAKIEILNLSSENIEIGFIIGYKSGRKPVYLQGKSGYFHASFTRDTCEGCFINLFHESGKGHIVGRTFYSGEGYKMEGDENTYLNGSRTPQIHGEGTEDDHNQGWGGSPYQEALWGALINAYQSAYRIFFGEAYVFDNEIEMNFECTNGGSAESVIYYYLSPAGPSLNLTDEIDIGNPDSEQEHAYKIQEETWSGTQTSAYDGFEKDPDYFGLTDDGRAYRGSVEFVVDISPQNRGVMLRKRLNCYRNWLQTGRVYVDGLEMEKPWHIATFDRSQENQAWMDTDYFIPPEFTSGKKKIQLKIEHNSSANDELNEFYYWIYSYENPEGQNKTN